MARRKLSAAAKNFVVQRLACFDSPSVVAEAVRKEFGETIARQSVEGFDPTKRAGAKLARQWQAAFFEARTDFLDDVSGIALAHKAARLRRLQRMADKAEDQGNMALAAQLLRQAAEEMGNSFTNRRELTGKDGKDLPPPVAPVTIFQLPDNGRG